jgi:aspartate aminotransferase
MVQPVSNRSLEVLGTIAPFYQFMSGPLSEKRAAGGAMLCDFVFGNPHEMALSGFTASLQQWIVPQNADWHAYKNSERPSQAIIAASLREQRGLPYEEDDIFLTNGAFAGLAVTLNSIVNPGDEVIFISPPWFFYEAQIVAAGGKGVRVKIDAQSFDLDIAAIQAAITARTRAIIVNSPHNPTGKIYPAETLTALARVLSEASRANGQTIYLLSDEAYSRIIFDDHAYPSPATFYANSLLIYTYGKVLLTPGERMGYIALSPQMAERETLRRSLLAMQFTTGFAFPNALLQHALGDLDKLSIDIPHLQSKRDGMVGALRVMGYDVHSPEATFYLLVKCPLPDEAAFMTLLSEHNILVMPGGVLEMPGYFRISLTANDDMIERALPGFAAAIERARSMVAAV